MTLSEQELENLGHEFMHLISIIADLSRYITVNADHTKPPPECLNEAMKVIILTTSARRTMDAIEKAKRA